MATPLFARWGGDAIGPLPVANGKRYIVLWIDYFSKWTVGRAVQDVSAVTMARSLLHDVVLEHGFPVEIVTDRGSGYTAAIMQEFTHLLSIKHRKSTAYHPQANGLAERTNQTMIEVIAKLATEEDAPWTEVFGLAKWAYNTTTRRSTGHSPYYLKYGMEPRLPADMTLAAPPQTQPKDTDIVMARLKVLKTLRKLRVGVLDILQLGYDLRAQERLNNERLRTVPLAPGDKVLRWRSYRDKDWSGKLEPHWDGPFHVTTSLGYGAYELSTLGGKPVRGNPVAGERLRLYFAPEKFRWSKEKTDSFCEDAEAKRGEFVGTKAT